MVEKPVACIMSGTIIDADRIPAWGGLLLSAGSAMARTYNLRPANGADHAFRRLQGDA
jgi:hypothetical protein